MTDDKMTRIYIRIGLTQITDLLPFVGSFLPCRGKKEPTKAEKYHAAAG
jgi:hypothetical protein